MRRLLINFSLSNRLQIKKLGIFVLDYNSELLELNSTLNILHMSNKK